MKRVWVKALFGKTEYKRKIPHNIWTPKNTGKILIVYDEPGSSTRRLPDCLWCSLRQVWLWITRVGRFTGFTYNDGDTFVRQK